MADRFHIVVIGLPELGRLLEEAEPGGAAVVAVAGGPDVERALAERARGATRDRALFVVALGPEPAVNRLPARLARGGFRTVVLAGLAGAEAVEPVDGVVVLAAPFSADDVVDALSRLPGDVPLLLPIEGGARVFGEGDVAEVEDDDDDLLGPVVTPLPLRVAPAVAHDQEGDDTEPVTEELPMAVGAPPLAWPPADEPAVAAPPITAWPPTGEPAVATPPITAWPPTGEPAVATPPITAWPPADEPAVAAPPLDAWPPADEPVRLAATVGAVALDTPPWAHLPPPAPPPPPVDRPVPWADGAWPVPPVIPGAVLPAPGAGGIARRGRVVAVCSYKGGSGKCLTGDALIVDPVTGIPHRLDEVVRAPELVTVLTLDGATIQCAPITAKIDSGVKATVRVELRSGRTVTVTPHHPFLLPDGWRPAADITVGQAVAVPARTPFPLRPRPLDGPALVALATEVVAGPGARPPSAGPATMPTAAFALPPDQLARLLGMLWAYLGTTGEDGSAAVALASEDVARAVQHLLTRFRVPSRIAPAAPGAPEGPWRLGVAPADVPTLRAQVILADPADPRPEPADGDDDRRWDEVVAITPAGDRQVWDLTVERTHCFVASDVVVHNTTTALMAAGTLARALQPAGKRVALVDANTAQSSVSTVLQRTPRGSVLDLVRSDVDDRLLASALTPVPEAGGLDVLFGAPDLRSTDRRLVTTALYRRIVAGLRRTHDYVVVDTPVAEAVDHDLFGDFVLRDSDLLLVVLDPNRETIHNNVEWLDIIGDPVSAGGRNVPPERIGVVLNRADPDQAWNARTVGDHFRRFHFLGAIPDSPAVQRAANEARLLDRFDAGVEQAVRAVLAALVDEPLVAPDADPAARSVLARLVAAVRAGGRRVASPA
jgi:MinD-like ATPase involved in chromosome partitioning or flagellar assembly